MKHVINIISLLLCAVIIGGSVVLTYTSMGGIEGAKKIAFEFVEALNLENFKLPSVPDDDETTGGGDGDNKPEPPIDGENNLSKEEQTFANLFESYSPEFAEIQQETLKSVILGNLSVEDSSTEVVSSVVNSYVDELYAEIEKIQNSNDGLTDEEKQKAIEEFSKKESAAYDSLFNLFEMNNGGSVTEDSIVDSVTTILDSKVCRGTLTSIALGNEQVANGIKESSANFPPDLKSELGDILTESYQKAQTSEESEECEAIADLLSAKIEK